MTNLKSGYVGLFKQPYDKTNLSTLYCITDDMHEVLIMIILSPSAYADAYRICKNITYTDIYIITPSIDVLFLSDLFNLVTKLRIMKPSLKWVYPKTPGMNTSIGFSLSQMVTDKFIYEDYNYFEHHIIIDFIPISHEGRNFCNLLLRDGEKSIYFSQYLNIEMLDNLHNDDTIDEIHLPYNSTLYGGLNFNQIVFHHNRYHTKCRIHSFLSMEEYNFCEERHKGQIGKVRLHDFI